MRSTLYYIHDPMCSWCWAFRPVWQVVRKQLPQHIEIKYLLGGLAADTNKAMPEDLQKTIRQTWLRIQKVVPGTEFNFDFWEMCLPRRSTYPACRAVIAARNQGHQYEEVMIYAIQQAYYLNAENPSDDEVLSSLAENLELDLKQFQIDLNSQQTQQQLEQEIVNSRTIGAQGFPSLIWLGYGNYCSIAIDYNNADIVLEAITSQ
ncbi:MAG: DsbA family protein [Methylococcales bacterium]